jgi:hypothetical protein
VWEAEYDDLLLDFVRRLKAFQTDGIVPVGTFCVPYVRSDEIILFVAAESGIPEGPTALGQKAAELDQLIRGYLAERADVSARFRSFVGAARIMKDPKHRIERLVYRGIQEAATRSRARPCARRSGAESFSRTSSRAATFSRCSSRSSTWRPAT